MANREAFRQKLQLIVAKYIGLSNELRTLSGRVFCARKVIIISDKGISSLPVSSKSQGVVVEITLLVLLWISFSTGKYVTHEQIISQKDREIWSTNVTNESLQYQMADLHQNLADLNKYFENIRQLDQISQQSPLKDKAGVHSARPQFANIGNGNEADKGKPASGSDGVQQILSNIRSKILSRISTLENMLQLTGLNLKKMADNNVPLRNAFIKAPHLHNEAAVGGKGGKNQGGPYVPTADPGAIFNQDEFESEINYLMQLEKVINTIPVLSPLKQYTVSSGFGRRMDPIYGEAAIHTGIDIAGAYKAKVYSSAPGRVIYAGMSGAYGRFVEIDHGSGITTRYGHLDRILVREGEILKGAQLLGLQGNSGRSTGTHLHYEVRLNDQPINPANFLEAGKYVF